MTEQHGPIKEQHGPYYREQPKRSIGNYDLDSRIDAGGMGEVYLAYQRTAFRRRVALKAIRPDLVHDPIARQRFLREAEVNSKLLHEHIPALIEFNEEQGQLYFVMPYIAGGTLAQRLQSGPLSLLETYQLFTALLSAVAYIHRHGVVHRDLKPSNILLDKEMEAGQIYVRLIDFGIASNMGHATDPRLTQAGTEMGTVIYMAPERLSGISAPSNDIFSLGIILYQMLTGHLPSVDRHIALPQPLEYVINRCVAPRLEDRFASAEEVLKAFEYAYQYLSAPQPAPVAVSGANSAFTTGGQAQLPGALSELAVFQQSGQIPLSSPEPDYDGFASGDYASPTDNINVAAAPPRRITGDAPTGPGAPRPRRRRNPVFAIVSGFAILVLLAMAGRPVLSIPDRQAGIRRCQFQPAGAGCAKSVPGESQPRADPHRRRYGYHPAALPEQQRKRFPDRANDGPGVLDPAAHRLPPGRRAIGCRYADDAGAAGAG